MTQLLPMKFFPSGITSPLPAAAGRELKEGDEVCTLLLQR